MLSSISAFGAWIDILPVSLGTNVRLYKHKCNTKPTSYSHMRRGGVIGPSRSNYGVSEITCSKTTEEFPNIYSRAPFILYCLVGTWLELERRYKTPLLIPEVSQSLLSTWRECGREDLWNVLMAQWTVCVQVFWGCSLKTQIWKSYKLTRQISKHSMYLKISYKFQLETWYTFSNNSKIITWKLY